MWQTTFKSLRDIEVYFSVEQGCDSSVSDKIHQNIPKHHKRNAIEDEHWNIISIVEDK